MKRLSLNPRTILVVLCGLIVALGIGFRAYNLTFPEGRVFDEVYFPVFAQNYIEGENFYDVHPPFGKFIIAAGMVVAGNSPFGWRVMPLLFGIGLIWLMARLWRAHFKETTGAWILAALVAMDGIFIIYSRTGLMDIILLFSTFLTLLVTFWARQEKGKGWRLWVLATVLGLTIAIKWPSIGLVIPIAILLRKRYPFPVLALFFLWSLFIYQIVVTAGQALIGSAHPILDGLSWNQQALQYHESLTATHPWGSEWWSWPFLLKPVLFLFDSISNGWVHVATTLGNPLTWWLSTAVVFGSTLYLLFGQWSKRFNLLDHPLTPYVAGYYALWLPWAAVTRVLFLYHYLPSYMFALCVLVYWLVILWKKNPWVVLGIIFACAAVSLFFLPFAVSWWPLSTHSIEIRVWLDGWL